MCHKRILESYIILRFPSQNKNKSGKNSKLPLRFSLSPPMPQVLFLQTLEDNNMYVLFVQLYGRFIL